jgi:hypothetical protein
MEAIDITEFPALCEILEEDGQYVGTVEEIGVTLAQLNALQAGGFITFHVARGTLYVEPVLCN